MIIAIDGPSGAGKSTVSSAVADRLGFALLDTGALYRGAAWLAREQSVGFEEGAGVAALIDSAEFDLQPRDGTLRLIIDGVDVSGAIRSPAISDGASRVSANPEVRRALLGLQRQLGRSRDCVVEGRDIGTVVFPDADCKFFLTASIDVRLQRRRDQYAASGKTVDAETMRREVLERDARDSSRAVAPLAKADDAVEVDSSTMSFDEVVDLIVSRARSAQGG